MYSKTCVKRPLSIRLEIGCEDQKSKVLQNALREHSAILLTFIKLPFIINTFVMSIFWVAAYDRFLMYIHNLQGNRMFIFLWHSSFSVKPHYMSLYIKNDLHAPTLSNDKSLNVTQYIWIYFPLRLFEGLSVTKLCPLYNLITVRDISTNLHTSEKHIQTMCHA